MATIVTPKVLNGIRIGYVQQKVASVTLTFTKYVQVDGTVDPDYTVTRELSLPPNSPVLQAVIDPGLWTWLQAQPVYAPVTTPQ